MKPIALFILLLGLSLGTTIQAQKVKKPIYFTDIVDNDKLHEVTNRFDRFKQQIMGHFSNRRQVEANPGLGEKVQEFIIVPIFKERTSEFWIYLEFFSPSMMDAPLDQRVERYVKLNRDTIRMEVYYLKDPAKWINTWKTAEPCKGITRDDLVRDASCDLLIAYNEDKPQTHTTVPPTDIDCSLKVAKGTSKYVFLWFELADKGYDMQFRFYDKDKKVIHEGHVIEFDRLDYKAKGYENYAPGVKPPKKTKAK